VSNIEQTAAAGHDCFIHVMTRDQWTELIACSSCGRSGPARLSQPESRPLGYRVEAVPPGFKVVRIEFGETFYCEVCNQLAVAKRCCQRCNAAPSVVRQILDTRTGKTVRMLECKCGERSWSD